MQAYYGTKLVYARAMNRAEYNAYRGWELPADEDGTDLGVLVEYAEPGQRPNHSLHEGYISWSPLEVFTSSYQPLTALSFGHAIEALESGQRVARAGWNGKGMFVAMVDAREHPPTAKSRKWLASDEPLANMPYMIMYTAQGVWQPGWLPSQADVFAKDWQVVSDDE